MKIAVFDVCGTIYNSNTTFEFLDDFFKKNNKYIHFRKITSNIFFVAANHYINKFFHVDLIRNRAISFLKGSSIKEIKFASRKFLTETLADKKVNNVFELIKHYRNEGYKIILMSASLDFIIEEIQTELNTDDYFSNQLENVDNLYTGKILKDMTSKKDMVLNENYKSINSLAVITDNLSDFQLVKSADDKHVICWKKKHHKFWLKSQINNIKYLNMYS